MVVDLPRCGPMLSPRVPNLVPNSARGSSPRSPKAAPASPTSTASAPSQPQRSSQRPATHAATGPKPASPWPTEPLPSKPAADASCATDRTAAATASSTKPSTSPPSPRSAAPTPKATPTTSAASALAGHASDRRRARQPQWPPLYGFRPQQFDQLDLIARTRIARAFLRGVDRAIRGTHLTHAGSTSRWVSQLTPPSAGFGLSYRRRWRFRRWRLLGLACQGGRVGRRPW